jgi:hypothetical protein
MHAYSKPEDEPARFLGFVSPGGFEKYFDELYELMQSEPSWPAADADKLLALMAKYDTYTPPILSRPDDDQFIGS